MDDALVNALQRQRPSLCLACDYDLTTLPDGLCPECGAAFTHVQLRDTALQRENKFRRLRRTLVVRGGTCILAAMAFVVVAALCAMAAMYFITLTTIAIVGASLLGAIIDQCLSLDRDRPTVTRAKIELAVACMISLCVIVSIGTVSAPFVACVLTTALCQVWRANGRKRGTLLIAMPGVWLLALAAWIVLSGQVRIMQGFHFSDWDVRSASVRYRTEAMVAIEARRQGLVVGGVGLVALVPWYARCAWVRAGRKGRASERVSESQLSGDAESGER